MKIIEKRPDGTLRVYSKPIGKSRTKQAFRDSVDVNKVVARHQIGLRHLAQIPNTTGVYADMSSIPDYQNALHIQQDAQNKFLALPSKIRAKFQNNPAQLISYLQDTKNDEEAIQLGLKSKINAPKESTPSPKVQPETTDKKE